MAVSILQRYQLNHARKNMLQFMVHVRRHNSRYRFVMSQDSKSCHLNNCQASMSSTFDTNDCHCYQLQKSGDVHRVPDCPILSFGPWGPPVDIPVPQTSDEPFHLFFQRLQDRTNLITWYEDYQMKSNALYFQKVSREKKVNIDVHYHKLFHEWHLTDCDRWNSLDWNTNITPNTCHCSKAMENPSQYLEHTYNMFDDQWIPKKPIKPMNHYKNTMQVFFHRERSFPIPYLRLYQDLTEAGFFWLNDGDAVQCAFCLIVLDQWKTGECPLRRHIQLNPKCPYLTDSLNLPFHMKHRRTFPDAMEILWKFNDYSQRLASFQNKWPKSDIVDPKTLAHAGFFYCGEGNDAVHCPYCQLTVKNWEKEDDPIEEHFKYRPKCPYLRNFKYGIQSSSSCEKMISKPQIVCKICFDREISITFQPCGHCVTCSSCSQEIFNCPICRKPVYHKITSYIG